MFCVFKCVYLLFCAAFIHNKRIIIIIIIIYKDNFVSFLIFKPAVRVRDDNSAA